MIDRIIELKITDDGLLDGVDGIAFVEKPAIELEFLAFNREEFETFNDYPKKAVENAKRGIELNKENDNKCATQVGKVRAQQLANGENLSLDTIRRMRSFLIRQKDNYDLAVSRKDYTACGYISYLLWGGKEALPWAEKKLRMAGEEFVESASGFRVGDYVSWTFAGRGKDTDRGRGQITDIRVSGEVKIPDSDFVFKPTKERPLALIETRSGKIVGQYIDNLRKIQKPEGFTEIEQQIFEGVIKEKTLIEKIKASLDVASLPNYTNEASGSVIPEKYFDDIDEETQDDIIDALKEVGIKIDDFANFNTLKGSSNPNKKTILDRGDRRVLFRYTRADGSMTKDGKERDFCAKMVDLSRQGYLWRKEDINSLTIKRANSEFGVYDLFAYKGSYGCRHVWKAVEFKEETADNMKKDDTKRPLAVLDGYISAGTTLNKDIVRKLFSQEDLDEEQVVATPIMVPNKLIPRRDEQGGYHVFFTEDTIKQIAYKFAELKAGDNINHEHDSDSMIEDVYLAESWIVEEPTNDKSNTFGYELPKGTWFGLFKVKNSDYWNDYIKSGKVKGVSVEGMFINKLSKLK